MGITFILKIINAILLLVAFITAIISLANVGHLGFGFDGCSTENCNSGVLVVVFDIFLLVLTFFMVFNSFFDFLKKWVPLTFLTMAYSITTIALGVALLFIAGVMGFVVGIIVIVWGVVLLLLLIFAAEKVAVAEAVDA